MRIALLEVVAMQGGHEVEFDRLIVHSLRALGHQPVFLVPPNFSFKIDYQAETHFLHGGKAIAHSNVSPFKRIVLSTLRTLRRILWFSDAYRIIKEQHIDAVIIPSATTRFISSILLSRLRVSPVPVRILIHGIEPKNISGLIQLAKSCQKYPNIHLNLLTLKHYDELELWSNVNQIPPQIFTPSSAKPPQRITRHSPLRLGFFGWYRKEKNIDLLLDVFSRANFKVPARFIVQAVAQGKEDNEALNRLIKKYESNPNILFLQKILIGQEWEDALSAVDAVVLPYAAEWHRYKWSAMLFNALGFFKPVLSADNINPELLQNYPVGETIRLDNPLELQSELETFVNTFDKKAESYSVGLKTIAEVFSPVHFARRILGDA